MPRDAGWMKRHESFNERVKQGNVDLIFIGDGDSISLCLAYLLHSEILKEGPARILVLDFDERIVNAVKRFADANRMSDRIDSRLAGESKALLPSLL